MEQPAHCNCMALVVLPYGSTGGTAERLRRLGLATSESALSPVPLLENSIASEVILVPREVFTSDRWARMRIDLSHAVRSFVVEVPGGDTGAVVAAMRDGAFDVLAPEDDDARWLRVLEAAGLNQELWLRLYAGRFDVDTVRMVGRSESTNRLRRELERLGPTDVTVLVLGESGVGKERVAVALHEAGRGGAMITLNCAAMPRELLESELFGAEKGAFTGAMRTRPGLVEQADGGTLFLDEVGEMDLTLQPKLLRFLETRRARRVGGEGEYSVRLRVVAATNRDLEREVQEGRFRADLYYRLAEVVVRVPPLRERREDIPDLARAFVQVANERFGKNIEGLEPELVLRLQEHSWPGNVRELKGTIDRLVLFHDGPILRAGWWEAPKAYWNPGTSGGPGDRSTEAGRGGPKPGEGFGDGAGAVSGLPRRRDRLALARQLLEEGRLPLSEIAARVGVHPTTLYRWRVDGKTGDEVATGSGGTGS